jgi:4-amino-4-deoxy-L-arabinose transferase-like glycosyltransferase
MTSIKIKTWVFISIVSLSFFIIPGFNHGLWRPDEPRVAGTCAEMVRTGDYVVPHLNGKPFLEKPPLYYAMGAVAGSVLGEDKDYPYRIVSLLFGIITIIITFLIASRNGGPVMGAIAGGILASSWEFFMLARWVQVDIILVFGVTLAMFSYQRLTDSSKVMDSITLGFATGIAFMAKGLVGPAIIAAAIIADIIRRKDIVTVWRIRPFVIIAFILIPILPWILALWDRGGWPFIREVIVVNNLMRFTGAPEGAALGHQNGPLYYLEHFPGNFLPWTLIFVPALITSVRKFKDDPYISWFLGPFILLSIASTKRGLYLVPLYPAAACMTANWLENVRLMKWEDIFLKISWVIAIAGCLAPLSGIFLGMPALGICMCLLSVLSCTLITRGDMKNYKGISLVMVTCIAMCACTTLYFHYMMPKKDYLGFARRAVTMAGSNEIVLLHPDETLEGAFPIVTGKTMKVLSSPADIRSEGVYLWAKKEDTFIKALNRQVRVDVLLENKIGDKILRIARIIPGPAGD